MKNPDGSHVKSTSNTRQKHDTNLSRFVLPQPKGGYGGRVFFSAKSGHLILAVNARTAVNPNLVERVEVPYVRNTNSEWRTDFSAISPYSTEISPNLKKARNGHFIEANKKLRNELKNNEDLRTRLNLSDEAMGIVNGTEGRSPPP